MVNEFKEYIKKPEIIEALQWEEPFPDIDDVEIRDGYGYLSVNGREKMLCPGDYLIRTNKIHLSMCKKWKFSKEYAEINECP